MLLCPQPLLRIKCTCQEESDCHGNSGMGGEPEDTASTHEPDPYLPMREAPPHLRGRGLGEVGTPRGTLSVTATHAKDPDAKSHPACLKGLG